MRGNDVAAGQLFLRHVCCWIRPVRVIQASKTGLHWNWARSRLASLGVGITRRGMTNARITCQIKRKVRGGKLVLLIQADNSCECDIVVENCGKWPLQLIKRQHYKSRHSDAPVRNEAHCTHRPSNHSKQQNKRPDTNAQETIRAFQGERKTCSENKK